MKTQKYTDDLGSRFAATIIELSKYTEHIYITALRKKNLSIFQYDLLSLLASRRKPIPLAELAMTLSLYSPDAMGVVDTLVRRGLLARERRPSRRTELIRVTEAGQEVLKEARSIWVQARRTLFSPVLAEHLDDLACRLQSLLNIIVRDT